MQGKYKELSLLRRPKSSTSWHMSRNNMDTSSLPSYNVKLSSSFKFFSLYFALWLFIYFRVDDFFIS